MKKIAEDIETSTIDWEKAKQQKTKGSKAKS